jgi:NAD-reducing hydrogenase small subunit
MLHKVRRRTKVLVSFGDCAVTGNVPAIRNQLGAGNDGKRPAVRLHRERAEQPLLPRRRRHRAELLKRVLPVHEVVPWNTTCPAARRRPTASSAPGEQVLAGLPPKPWKESRSSLAEDFPCQSALSLIP